MFSKKRRGWQVLLFVVIVLALASLACGSLLGGDDEEPTVEPVVEQPVVEEPVEEEPPKPSGDEAKLTVENQSEDTICYLFVSPTTADTWGDDKLGTDDVVGPGQSTTISVPADTYDFKVDDCEGNSLAERYDNKLPAGGAFTWTLSAGVEVNIDVVNESPYSVCGVYISLSGEVLWGPNQLPTDTVLEVGQSYLIPGIPVDFYDIKTEDCSGNVISWNVNTDYAAAYDEFGPELAYTVEGAPSQLNLQNDSSLAICGVQMRFGGSPDYFRSIVDPQRPIPPGSLFIASSPTGSTDLLASTCEGGITVEQLGADIQAEFTWTITD